MGKAKKRKREPSAGAGAGKPRGGDDEPAASPEQGRLAALLAALPRGVLLTLRRDLAMGPFAEALRALREAGPHSEVADALDEAGDATAARLLPAALCIRQLHCWTFAAHAATVDAGRASLDTLLEDARGALLADLRRSEEVQGPFCRTIKKHVGNKTGDALMRLGRARAMWLVGAHPDEPGTVCSSDRKPRRAPEGQASKEVAVAGAVASATDEAADGATGRAADGATEGAADSTADGAGPPGDDIEADEDAATAAAAPAPGAAKAAKAKTARRGASKAKARKAGGPADDSSSNGDEGGTLEFLRRFREKRQRTAAAAAT